MLKGLKEQFVKFSQFSNILCQFKTFKNDVTYQHCKKYLL